MKHSEQTSTPANAGETQRSPQFVQEELKCPHGRPVSLGPCALCELEALNAYT